MWYVYIARAACICCIYMYIYKCVSCLISDDEDYNYNSKNYQHNLESQPCKKSRQYQPKDFTFLLASYIYFHI